MILRLPPNKIYNQEQELQFTNNIVTFIGSNGCGKSAILESVFKEYLNDRDKNIICFTTGQNESFTPLYQAYLNNAKKELINNSFEIGEDRNVKSFFFDITWARILPFFATSIRRGGKLAEFLQNRDLVDYDSNKIDNSTKLELPFRVDIDYVRKIQGIKQKEETDPYYSSIRKTVIHDKILSLINGLIDEDYDFEDSITKGRHTLKAFDVPRILDTNVDSIFTFLWYATYSTYNFLDIEECSLYFKNNLEINDLSDGEFVLILLYSLIDLFDAENTIFVLDEIDSHLYFENIERLWTILKSVKGKILTTTHTADSIMLNHFESIHLVNGGKIIEEEDAKADIVLKRMSTLTRGESYKFRIASKLKYIALVESRFDWYVFKKLCKKKVTTFDQVVFNKIHPIICSGGYNSTGQIFGESKIEWINLFNMFVSSQDLETKAIFMICDRDNFQINDITGVRVNRAVNIGRENEYKICNHNNRKAYLLSWKRREIENYLLSHTVLEEFELLERVNELLPTFFHMESMNPNDNGYIQDADVKNIVQELYLSNHLGSLAEGESGVDYSYLNDILSYIPKEEISEDIENMYNFIISKIQ